MVAVGAVAARTWHRLVARMLMLHLQPSRPFPLHWARLDGKARLAC